MKRFTKYLALFSDGSLRGIDRVRPRKMNEVDVQNNPAINSTTLSPMTDESGSVRAYVGTGDFGRGDSTSTGCRTLPWTASKPKSPNRRSKS